VARGLVRRGRVRTRRHHGREVEDRVDLVLHFFRTRETPLGGCARLLHKTGVRLNRRRPSARHPRVLPLAGLLGQLDRDGAVLERALPTYGQPFQPEQQQDHPCARVLVAARRRVALERLGHVPAAIELVLRDQPDRGDETSGYRGTGAVDRGSLDGDAPFEQARGDVQRPRWEHARTMTPWLVPAQGRRSVERASFVVILDASRIAGRSWMRRECRGGPTPYERSRSK
jgi:hypothetical protein